MNVRELRVVVEEIARVALEREDISKYIGRELDLADWYLDEVYRTLEKKIDEIEPQYAEEIKLRDENGNYMGMMGGHEVRK